jgi:hypothetical protein
MYVQTISRANPALVLFLIDESKSMQTTLAGHPVSKIVGLANALNKYLFSIVTRCECGEDTPRHYFDIAVIGYTTDKANSPRIRSVLPHPLSEKPWVSPQDLDRHALATHPEFIWYYPPKETEMFGTPTADAFRHINDLVGKWCRAHPKSLPPIVFHLTDGEAFNGDPEPIAHELRTLATDDGPALLFNFHLSAAPATPILLPAKEEELPAAAIDDSKYARSLFRMSSQLPETLVAQARLNGFDVRKDARGMAFNATYLNLEMLISMGTPTDIITR